MAKGARNMKIFAKYFDENGEVYMFRPNEIYDSATNTFKPTDEKTFTVAMEKFSPLGNSHILQHTVYDFEEAIDEYLAYIDKLHDRVPARMCAANPKDHRKCSAANCPKELGGAAFWQLFRTSCMNRTK